VMQRTTYYLHGNEPEEALAAQTVGWVTHNVSGEL